MIYAECRVHLLPNAVGKGRLSIFREACEKFSLQAITPFDLDRVDCVLVEDTLDPHVVVEKILHLDPSSDHLPQLVSTRWLSESLRAQSLLPREPFIRSLTRETTTARASSNEGSLVESQKASRTKFTQDPPILPRVRSNSDSDYDDIDEDTNASDQELIVRVLCETLKTMITFTDSRPWLRKK